MIRRRGLLAICLLAAGAAAFRRRRFQPNWSFRRSADWLIARTPTRYGDALRTIRKCMDCDSLEVSLQNHSFVLKNATLSLDDEEALRVERLEVVVESYSPLVVSASLGTVKVSVNANDLPLWPDTICSILQPGSRGTAQVQHQQTFPKQPMLLVDLFP